MRGISAPDSSATGGVFAEFDVHRAAERRAGQARAAKWSAAHRRESGHKYHPIALIR